MQVKHLPIGPLGDFIAENGLCIKLNKTSTGMPYEEAYVVDNMHDYRVIKEVYQQMQNDEELPTFVVSSFSDKKYEESESFFPPNVVMPNVVCNALMDYAKDNDDNDSVIENNVNDSIVTIPYDIIDDKQEVGAEENNQAIDFGSSEKAEVIINMLLCSPDEFELKSRPYCIRKNVVCTLSFENISIEQCKADGNGAYKYIGNPKKFYHVKVSEGSLTFCAMVNKENDSYYYNVRNNGSYSRTYVSKTTVYELSRTYRKSKYNKFQQMIAVLRQIQDTTPSPYYLLSYRWLDGNEHSEDDFVTARHGNSKLPHNGEYVRQDKMLKEKISEKVSSGKNPSTVYHELVDEAQVYMTLDYVMFYEVLEVN